MRWVPALAALLAYLSGCAAGSGGAAKPDASVNAAHGRDAGVDAAWMDAEALRDAESRDGAPVDAHPGVDGAEPPVLADYDRELREAQPRSDGIRHVASAGLVSRLVELHANRYAYLIYHKPTDWEDLQEFLPLAEAAGLKTWVYLVPPTELPDDYPPFQDDYVAWADAIGRLAADHPGLEAFVMDDFDGNVGVFTPDYVRSMVDAARSHQPGLKFYVISYYPWVFTTFSDAGYVGRVDGIIFPYRDLDSNADLLGQIEQIAALRSPGAFRIGISYPAHTASAAGQAASYVVSCRVAPGARIRFVYLDSYDGPTTGYHEARVLLDEAPVWTEDTGGVDRGESVDLDLSGMATPGSTVELRFQLYERQGVGNYAVTAVFSSLRLDGCGSLASSDWHYEENASAFQGSLEEMPSYPDLDLIVMIYAMATSWHSEAPATTTIRQGLQIGLSAWESGLTQGVITYCLDKSPNSDDFDAVRDVYVDHASGP